MKPLRLELKVKNNRLYSLIYGNYVSIRDFCQQANFPYPIVSGLLTLRVSPFRKDGKYCKLCCRIAEYFKMLVEDLFPKNIYTLPHRKANYELDVPTLPLHKAYILPAPEEESPEAIYRRKEDMRKILYLLAHLTPREQEILELRFGLAGEVEHSLKEIGKRFKVSHERIRQIELYALRKLHNWSNAVYGEKEKSYNVFCPK